MTERTNQTSGHPIFVHPQNRDPTHHRLLSRRQTIELPFADALSYHAIVAPLVATSPTFRSIRQDELPDLLALYRHLHPADPEMPITLNLEDLWARICADPSLHYLVAEVRGTIASTCTLAIIPNLTRSARPYGLIENVVTHPDFRKQGLATRLLHRALEIAWEQNCYKVMLLTGRKDEATLRFYQNAGFEAGEKTGFVAKP